MSHKFNHVQELFNQEVFNDEREFFTWFRGHKCLHLETLERSDNLYLAGVFTNYINHLTGYPIVNSEGSYWLWNGFKWIPLSRGNLIAMICVLFDGQSYSNSTKNNTVSLKRLTLDEKQAKLIFNNIKILIRPDEVSLSNGEVGVACGGDFIKFDIGNHRVKVVDNDPSHLTTMNLMVDLGDDWENAKCPPMLQSHFNRVWGEDSFENTRFMGEWIGIALSGLSTNFLECCMLIGQGGTGKSATLDIVKGLFPEDSVSSISMDRWDDPTQLVGFVSKRLNYDPEMPRDFTQFTKNENIVRKILSGEPVQAKRLYENSFTFSPKLGHIFAGNDIPVLPKTNLATFKRFKVLKFDNVIRHTKDARLTFAQDVLDAERDAIILWALASAKRVVERGSYSPLSSSSTSDMNREFMSESNPVFAFVDEELEVTSHKGNRAETLYEGYLAWCDHCEEKPLSKYIFGQRLTDLSKSGLFDKQRHSDGNYYSLAFKDFTEEEKEENIYFDKFLEERCETSTKTFTKYVDIYDAYVAWTEENQIVTESSYLFARYLTSLSNKALIDRRRKSNGMIYNISINC